MLKKNKTYGLSTLRTRHVNHTENNLRLEFTGKRGKKHNVTIEDEKLLKLINKCEEISGWELFNYFDEKGEKHTISSTLVNDYIHNNCGSIFSAKDFRTWAGSLIAFDTLRESFVKARGFTNKKSTLINAIDATANSLHNTRAVCKKYYVHPHILESYINETITPYFEMVSTTTKQNSDVHL